MWRRFGYDVGTSSKGANTTKSGVVLGKPKGF
nr:MAG TPA: hemagglutinin [Caudoviricetes sp.]